MTFSCRGLRKCNWCNLLRFWVLVSYQFQGQLSEPVTPGKKTKFKKNKKKNKSRERKWKTCLSIFVVFHNQASWCKQMSELSCWLKRIPFSGVIGRDSGLLQGENSVSATTHSHIWMVAAVAVACRRKEEKKKKRAWWRIGRVINPHSQAAALHEEFYQKADQTAWILLAHTAVCHRIPVCICTSEQNTHLSNQVLLVNCEINPKHFGKRIDYE